MPSGPVINPSLSIEIGFIIALIVIIALLSAGNGAITSCSRNKIKHILQEMPQKNKKAELLLEVLEDPTRLIFSMEIIITFSGFLVTAIGTIGLTRYISAFFIKHGVPYNNPLSVIVITFILAFVVLVLGHIYPKRVAIRNAEKTALSLVGPLYVLSKIVAPFSFLINIIVDLILKITRQDQDTGEGEFSEDDIMSLLEVGQEEGALKEEGRKMIDSIFKFDDKLAYEIMTPRTDVFCIDINDPAEEYLEELMELRYSRIPVYEDDTDNVIGILHIKDYLIQARKTGFDHVDIRKILRDPYYIPETKNIDSLFFELQSTKNHIAILIDEFGGFSGIVTMEDIIEEIMGDIDDEYDEQETEIEEIGENEYLISGFAYLSDINEQLGVDLDSDNSETLGGLIMDILGEIPDDNEHVDQDLQLDDMIFTILSIKERRIEKVRLKILNEQEEQ